MDGQTTDVPVVPTDSEVTPAVPVETPQVDSVPTETEDTPASVVEEAQPAETVQPEADVVVPEEGEETPVVETPTQG